jgi:glycerol-1-phosphate dehydrogenase [NAD(P)+]
VHANVKRHRLSGAGTTVAMGQTIGSEFATVFGRGLVGELQRFAHRPYLVVTMADLWPRFEPLLQAHLAGVHLVTSIDVDYVSEVAERLPPCGSVIGLGGGKAADVAKFFAWQRRLPLFQVPTAMTTNAPFAHRSILRSAGKIEPIGWAVPEAVYVDYDVIKSAPPLLNRSGVCDVLCYHTAQYDWKLAHDTGREESRWPYDERLVAEAKTQFDTVFAALGEIRAVTDEGIRSLMLAHRWGGAAFHSAGWNLRHLDGVDHNYLYCLEYVTGRQFIHGQGVGLGIYVGCELQQNEPTMMLDALARTGVDIRPEAMGITWKEASTAMHRLAWYGRYADLPWTVADVAPATDEVVERIRQGIYRTFGAWPEAEAQSRVGEPLSP